MTISLNNLSFAYSNEQFIFKKINLTIPSGFSLLIGPTGCGKSTLLKTIADLYPKYAGHLSGQVNLNKQTCSMMFQNASQQFTMATAREEIIFALENLKVNSIEAKKRLKKAISFTKIEQFADQKINTLSGGQQQRVALAVLIAMNVDILLLDEPFASCDPDNRKFLIYKLAQLSKTGKTIIISDHDLSGYAPFCNRIYQMKDQQLFLLSKEATQKLLTNLPNKKVVFALPDFNKNKSALFYFDHTVLKQQQLLLKQDNLKILTGKNTLITGANGVGKTSLFKALTKMLPYQGSLQYQTREISKLNTSKYLQHVVQIFQNADDQFLKITVDEEINLSKKNRNSYFTDKKIQQSLRLLKLDQHLNQVVYSLSGGQKKKLQILLMLIGANNVILLDEPLSGLDQKSINDVLKLMTDSQKQLHQTFLIISHQIDDALNKLCDYHLLFSHQNLKYVNEA